MLNKILVFLFAFFYASANDNNNVWNVNSNGNFGNNNFDNPGVLGLRPTFYETQGLCN